MANKWNICTTNAKGWSLYGCIGFLYINHTLFMRQHFIGLLGLLLILALAACDDPKPQPPAAGDPAPDSTTAAAPAPPEVLPMPDNVTGTYVFGDQEGTEGGGYLVVKQLEGDQIKFELDLNRGAPNFNSGTATGTLDLKGNRAEFTTTEYDMSGKTCLISFVFQGDEVVVDQEQGSDMACGFGHAVYAHGTYKKINDQPTFRYKEEGTL